MQMKMIFSLLFYNYVIHFSRSEKYNVKNVQKVFNYFKQKYNKVYKNADEEEQRLINFVHNMNAVDSLNEKDSFKFYTINKYADEDPEDVQEHFALGVHPYDAIVNHGDTNFLRSHTPEAQKTKDMDRTALYDLANADELWEEYLAKYKKKYKKELDNTIHYYRFIKTLVEKNRQIFQEHSKVSEENPALDGNADIVREPNEFFV